MNNVEIFFRLVVVHSVTTGYQLDAYKKKFEEGENSGYSVQD